MNLARYSLVVLGLSAVAALGLRGLLQGPEERWAASFGVGLAGVNSVVAHGLFRWSRGRSTKAFLIAVLGGMGARLVLTAGAVLVALFTLGLPTLPLVVSLLLGFAVFLGLEVVAQHRPATVTQ